MIRTMIILLLIALLSPSMALEQLPFGMNSDQWLYVAIPARSLPGFVSHSNQRNIQPAVRRDDYIYTPGIGAHKVHTKLATWNEARRICNYEGGHLAIINSVAEAEILGSLLNETEPSKVDAFIGFHDYFQPGEYLTVHSEPLAEAGFTQWMSGEPSNDPEERCGGVYNVGKLCDINCNTKWIFICEIPFE